MTGAGVTSAPSMPVGSPTAAPSRSQCTYVWPLLLWPPLPMDSHSSHCSPGPNLLLCPGCLLGPLRSLGPDSFFEKAGSFGRTDAGPGIETAISVCAILMMSLGPSLFPSLIHLAKVYWALTTALSVPVLDTGATEIKEV